MPILIYHHLIRELALDDLHCMHYHKSLQHLLDDICANGSKYVIWLSLSKGIVLLLFVIYISLALVAWGRFKSHNYEVDSERIPLIVSREIDLKVSLSYRRLFAHP